LQKAHAKRQTTRFSTNVGYDNSLRIRRRGHSGNRDANDKQARMRDMSSLPIFGSTVQELKLHYTKMKRRVALPGTTDSSDETYSFVRCLAIN
jgi:hypothetical protein